MINNDLFLDPEKSSRSEIIFRPIVNQPWIMRLTKKGIEFNKEDYPLAKEDDFAKAIIKILEQHFTIKFFEK